MRAKFVPSGWELPQEIQERLGRSVGRQRAMAELEHLLIILHAPPQAGQDEREGRVFWRAPDGLWKTSKGKGIKGLLEHIAEYQAIIDELEAEEAKAQSAEDYFSVLERANPIARACRNMHVALQQARDLEPDDMDLICARDDAYSVERNAELFVSDIRNGFDLYVAKKTEQMTQSGHSMAVAGHRLNSLAALFLPTTALAALLGMNVQHGLEAVPGPGPFVAAVLAGIVMGIAVKSWMDRPVDR